MKYSLSELQENAVYARILTAYKVLGFNTDMKLLTLSKHLMKFVNYAIEDSLKEVNDLILGREKELCDPITSAYFQLPDEEQEKLREVVNLKINRTINSDELMKDLVKKRDSLWAAEHEYDYIGIEIPDDEYDVKFQDTRSVVVDKKEYRMDGYLALIELVSRGILILN